MLPVIFKCQVHTWFCVRHSGLCPFWKSYGFLGHTGKWLPWGERGYRTDDGPSAALGAFPEGRPRVLLAFEAECTLPRAQHCSEMGCQLEEEGGQRELLLTWNEAASKGFALCGGGVQARGVLHVRWGPCHRQDRRAVSVGPTEWGGSRSFAGRCRGAVSSFLSLQGL